MISSAVTPLNLGEPGKDLVLVAKDIVHELLDDLTDNEEPDVLAIVEGKV